MVELYETIIDTIQTHLCTHITQVHTCNHHTIGNATSESLLNICLVMNIIIHRTCQWLMSIHIPDWDNEVMDTHIAFIKNQTSKHH